MDFAKTLLQTTLKVVDTLSPFRETVMVASPARLISRQLPMKRKL